jgi:hypothetical protein
MPWKHIDVVLYLTAVKLPGTCTRSVLRSFEMATHIMTLPPPKLSTFWTQEEEKRSFWRLYTRILPLHFCSRKRDSSLNQILRQFRNVQPLILLHQRTLSRLCNCVNTAPKYDLLGLMPSCRSRLRNVCELILRNPGIPAAVIYAATVRFRRWKTRMDWSYTGVVMRGLPLLWWSFVEPVCWNLFHSLDMVLWLTYRVRATSFWDSPAWRRPIAIFRVAGSNLGMAAYQLSNKSQDSNFVLLYALV